VAVASAEPYASLHLAPDRQLRQQPTTQFFTGRMPFLPPNQQRQSTEGITNHQVKVSQIFSFSNAMSNAWGRQSFIFYQNLEEN